MEIKIDSNVKIPEQYWAVGSSYGGTDDQTNKFLANNEWIEGWGRLNDNRLESVLETVNVGDIFAMKSSATKGANHHLTFTKLKAIGIVNSRSNYYTFSVKWYNSKRFPLDFNGIRYSKTIESLRDDDLLKFVKDFILKLKQVK